MADERLIPGRPRAMGKRRPGAIIGSRPSLGGAGTIMVPVKSTGQHTERLYCRGCGHLKTKCICP